VTINPPNPCEYACSADIGVCIPPPSPVGEITAFPQFVVPGDTVVVSWDIDDALDCDVVGTSGESWANSVTSAGASCTHSGNGCVSLPVNAPARFTISCTGVMGTTMTDYADVSFVPQWQEI
jgi:hypothetical protein